MSTARNASSWRHEHVLRTGPTVDLAYNSDGSIATWRLRRRSTTTDIDMMNRTYSAWPDGALKGWTSSVGADPARSFFWDGADRLTCAANVAGLSACPTNASVRTSTTLPAVCGRSRCSRPA